MNRVIPECLAADVQVIQKEMIANSSSLVGIRGHLAIPILYGNILLIGVTKPKQICRKRLTSQQNVTRNNFIQSSAVFIEKSIYFSLYRG